MAAEYPQCRNKLRHSSGLKCAKHSPRNGQSVSVRRQRAVRTRALSFAKQSSMGLRSGRLRWPGPEGGPGSLDGALDAGDLVGPENVGNDDVAGLQGRHQDLFDVGADALAIDRAVEDTRCGQPRDPQPDRPGVAAMTAPAD